MRDGREMDMDRPSSDWVGNRKRIAAHNHSRYIERLKVAPMINEVEGGRTVSSREFQKAADTTTNGASAISVRSGTTSSSCLSASSLSRSALYTPHLLQRAHPRLPFCFKPWQVYSSFSIIALTVNFLSLIKSCYPTKLNDVTKCGQVNVCSMLFFSNRAMFCGVMTPFS
jgi:hypothetical protein